MAFDFERRFDYENGFYLTASADRIGKLAAHMELYRRIAEVPGHVVECGVFKGSSLSRFAKFRDIFENPLSRKIVGFDIFGRFPDAEFEGDDSLRDRFVSEAGDQSTTPDALMEMLAGSGSGRGVELVAGDVRETIPAYLKENPALRLALLHVDVDLYEATKACLDHFYPRVVRGGIVILDDYTTFPGANKAVEEYFGTEVRVQRLPYTPSISYVVKP